MGCGLLLLGAVMFVYAGTRSGVTIRVLNRVFSSLAHFVSERGSGAHGDAEYWKNQELPLRRALAGGLDGFWKLPGLTSSLLGVVMILAGCIFIRPQVCAHCVGTISNFGSQEQLRRAAVRVSIYHGCLMAVLSAVLVMVWLVYGAPWLAFGLYGSVPPKSTQTLIAVTGWVCNNPFLVGFTFLLLLFIDGMSYYWTLRSRPKLRWIWESLVVWVLCMIPLLCFLPMYRVFLLLKKMGTY
jgi:hypothetical protein